MSQLISLTFKNGYCFASNEYLANSMNVTKRTISKSLSNLKTQKYIIISYENQARKIYLNKEKVMTKTSMPMEEKFQSNIEKKFYHNKKEKQLAIKSLLSSKVLENELTVVEKLEMKEAKTKEMVKTLSNLKVEGKTLIIVADKNENVYLSSRNIEGVKAITLNMINVYDLLQYNKLVLPLETVKKLEEVYA